MVCHDGLYQRSCVFWDLIPFPNQSASAIAAYISCFCNKLLAKKYEVVAVVNDNAANEIAALKPDKR